MENQLQQLQFEYIDNKFSQFKKLKCEIYKLSIPFHDRVDISQQIIKLWKTQSLIDGFKMSPIKIKEFVKDPWYVDISTYTIEYRKIINDYQNKNSCELFRLRKECEILMNELEKLVEHYITQFENQWREHYNLRQTSNI